MIFQGEILNKKHENTPLDDAKFLKLRNDFCSFFVPFSWPDPKLKFLENQIIETTPTIHKPMPGDFISFVIVVLIFYYYYQKRPKNREKTTPREHSDAITKFPEKSYVHNIDEK